MSMRITSIFWFFLLIANSYGFSRPLINDKKQLITRKHMFETYDSAAFNQISTIKRKTSGLLTLIRPGNLIPASLLCFTGGFVMNPTLSLFKNSQLYISTLVTLIVMSNSMVLNDLFDIELDKINNPGRPLASGQINRFEAFRFASILFILSEWLSLRYLNLAAQKFVHVANFLTVFYTPIFKRIPFFKNIVCGGLIAFSTVFTGIAIGSSSSKNYELLSVLFKTIFFGSLNVEILMDIFDMDGDKKNGVKTLPVLFGQEFAWNIANNISLFSILTTTFSMANLYDIRSAIYFFILQSPLYYDMIHIQTHDFQKAVIKKYANGLIYPLVFTLAYLCLVAGLK
jgi:geranylgeranylglycerol-phosphate geranylgeranyltransferase